MFFNVITRFARNVTKTLTNPGQKSFKPLGNLKTPDKIIKKQENSPIPKQVKEKQTFEKPSKAPKSSKKPAPSDFPEELSKIGLSKKLLDSEMLEMYKSMKAKGADKLAKSVIDKYLKEGESSDEIIDNVVLKKPKSEGNYKDLFPGKKTFDHLGQKSFLPDSNLLNKELNQFVIVIQDFQKNLYQDKDLQNMKKKDFKELVKKDALAAEDKKKDREYGWLDKVDPDEIENKYFDKMIADLPHTQRKYFYDLAQRDKARLAKELKKL